MTLDHIQSWLFVVSAGALVIFIGMHLAARNRNSRSKFSFDDLLVDQKTGLTSPARVVLMGTFVVGSLVVVYGAFIRSLSDAMFLAYCATFAAPAVVKIITDAGVEKAAATPDPAPVTIDRQINMTAGDAPTPADSPAPTKGRAKP